MITSVLSILFSCVVTGCIYAKRIHKYNCASEKYAIHPKYSSPSRPWPTLYEKQKMLENTPLSAVSSLCLDVMKNKFGLHASAPEVSFIDPQQEVLYVTGKIPMNCDEDKTYLVPLLWCYDGLVVLDKRIDVF